MRGDQLGDQLACTGSRGSSATTRAKAASRRAARSASEAFGMYGVVSTMVCSRSLRVAGSRASGGAWTWIAVMAFGAFPAAYKRANITGTRSDVKDHIPNYILA